MACAAAAAAAAAEPAVVDAAWEQHTLAAEPEEEDAVPCESHAPAVLRLSLFSNLPLQQCLC